MGVVYRAKQLSLKRTVAIKILRPELADNRSFTERFHREARAGLVMPPNLEKSLELSAKSDLIE